MGSCNISGDAPAGKLRHNFSRRMTISHEGNAVDNTVPTAEYQTRKKNNMNLTKTWLKAALIRAIKTVAQTAVATIGTAAVLDEVNWIAVASAAALAGILSLLTSVAGIPEVK